MEHRKKKIKKEKFILVQQTSKICCVCLEEVISKFQVKLFILVK